MGDSKYGSLDEQRIHLNFGRFTRPLVANESWKHWWEWYGQERGTPHLPVEGKLGPKGGYKSFTVALVKGGTLRQCPLVP